MYKIADIFVKFLFNHSMIEQEFYKYETSADEISDVDIEIIQSKSNLSFFADRGDNERLSKIIRLDPDFRRIVWQNNEYIEYSQLKMDHDNARAVISLFVDNERKISSIPVSEIRYAIMYPLFAFMFFKGVFPLHSCGMTLNGIGILISGVSGSVKSSIGEILVNQYGASYLGEDINACSGDGFFYGIPFSKVNQNARSRIDVVIFLGDRTFKLERKDIVDCLMKSEFAVPEITQCYKTVNKLALDLENNSYCYMISHGNYTIEESALFVNNLVEQING